MGTLPRTATAAEGEVADLLLDPENKEDIAEVEARAKKEEWEKLDKEEKNKGIMKEEGPALPEEIDKERVTEKGKGRERGKEKGKDKERDKDKDRKKGKDKGKGRDKGRDWERSMRPEEGKGHLKDDS